jgi:PAS domain S-box-containing protein
MLRRWLGILGAVLVTLAAIVCIGRFGGWIRLVTLIPHGSPMAFVSALGFLLAGLALLAHAGGRPALGRVASVAVVLLSGGILLLYAFADQLGIVRFRYDPAHPVISIGVGFDGRMSPVVAGAFLLLGAALLMLGAQKFRLRLVATCVGVLLGVALLALVSYLTGLRSAVAWWRYTAMALHTAAGLLVGATALIVWMMQRVSAAERAGARTLPFFVGAGTAILALGAVVAVSNEQRQEAARAVNHSLAVAAGIDQFIAGVARLESSTRAFGLTGEERYLDRIAVHRASILAAADELVRLTTDNPEQHTRAVALRPLVEQKFQVNEAQVRARREAGVAAAARVLLAEPPELMAGLRASTDALQAGENRRLQARREISVRNDHRLQRLLLLGAVATIGLVAAAFSLVNRAQRDLQGAADALEARVHERTAALEASTGRLRESEGRLRFLADTMPQLVWTARPDATIESVNLGWQSYLAVSSEAAAIKALDQVVHPDDQAATSAEWQGMFREARPGGGELRLRRHDGAYRWHLWRAHPERDSSGRMIRWVGTSTDIHDQKLAEESLERRVAERTAELATSEERFRHTFHFAGSGMAMVGLDGRWLRVNKSLCEIVGYSEVELLAKTFQDITHPGDLATDLARVQELIDGKVRFYQLQKRYLHREGHVVWINLTVSLVHDAAGRPLHFVSQVEDINERKQLEENLARARDQALEASRMKSEFLATMSHEIRTPMNGVIGMTSLLRDTPLTETQSEYVRTIEASGESLLAILNDILDYSKIEAGRIELEVAAFDLRQCVEDALDLFAGRALEKKIELVYIMGPAVPGHVAGDVTRLRQVLANLLGNAVKFTETGEIVVTIDAEPVDGRHRLSFAVKDTGIGIPPEGMERLFKSFSQVDSSTTRRFGGTGLGLVISRRLTELMGGEMWAESRAGEGSIFHFTVLVDARPHLVQHNLQTRQPDLEGRRVLVVDDNASNRRVVASLATAWGMSVREAPSARGALELLAADPACDVAVIDMHMPEMDGEQLAIAIRALPAAAHLPLVLLTSLGRRTRSPHFAHALSKPVKADALFSAFRACVRPEAAVGGKATPLAPAHDASLGRRYPLRVLVAEDNPVNQKVVNLLLQRLGYRSTTVANGLEVIEAFNLLDYDVVLMDVEMPELDGCEATRRLREAKASTTKPWIIALTASAMQNDRERAFAAGMNDFITKPLRTEALTSALVRAHEAVGVPGANT